MKKDKIKIMVIEDFINFKPPFQFHFPLRTSLLLNTLKIYLFFVAEDELKENCEKVRKKIVFFLVAFSFSLCVYTRTERRL
jgi:hypothetical protein